MKHFLFFNQVKIARVEKSEINFFFLLLFFNSLFSVVIHRDERCITRKATHKPAWTKHVQYIYYTRALSHRFFSRELRILISDPLHLYNRPRHFPLILLFHTVAENIFLVPFLSFTLSISRKVRTCHLSYDFLIRHAVATLFNTPTLFFFISFSLSLWFSWSLDDVAYMRTSHFAFSAFLSTENDLHHNLRRNIGGHTSRHNNRVPSFEILNGQGGCFLGEGEGEKEGNGGEGQARKRLEIFEGRERKGEKSAMQQRICHHNNNINNNNVRIMITIITEI